MFDAYKIGVTLSLTNHVSKGLMMLAGDFMKTEVQATLLQKRIDSIKNDALKGGLMLGAGAGMLAMLKGPLDEARKFQTETAKFSSLGFGDAATSQAVKFASSMQTVGTSARDNLTLLSDAMAVFKNLDHAEFAAPIMAKMKFANEAVFGAKGGEHSAKFMDMLKVIEFRGGLSSEKEFDTQANFVQQVIAGSRNRVDATALLSALKTGGVALSRRSNEQFYLGAEPLIQEFGGQRYGTGAMSVYQNLVQSRGTVTAQQELYRLGLLNPKMVEFNTLGNLKKARAGAFVGSDVLENQGELALLQQVLLPAFAKKGITGDENIIRELGLILGNRTGSSLMGRIYQQRDQIGIQSAANAHAENIDQLSARAAGTLDGKQIDLHAKFNNLLLLLGNVVLPMAIKGLEWLIPKLKSLSDWMMTHTSTVKLLVDAFVLLAGGLMIRGTVLLLSAAFRGLGLALLFQVAGGPAGIAKLAPLLGAIGSRLGQLANIGLAFGIGWTIGTLLNDALISGTKFGDWLGGFIAKILAFMGNKEAQAAIEANKTPFEKARDRVAKEAAEKDRIVAIKLYGTTREKDEMYRQQDAIAKGRGATVVHTQVNLDGRVIASVVTREQSKAAARPQTGSGGFNTDMTPMQPGTTR